MASEIERDRTRSHEIAPKTRADEPWDGQPRVTGDHADTARFARPELALNERERSALVW